MDDYSFRPYGLTEQDLADRLRSYSLMDPDSDDTLCRAADCIENLVAFRESFHEKHKEADTKIVRLGAELHCLRECVEDAIRRVDMACKKMGFFVKAAGERPFVTVRAADLESVARCLEEVKDRSKSAMEDDGLGA